MAATHTAGANMALLAAGLPTPPGFAHGTVRSFTEKITFAEQDDASTIKVAQLPKGAIVLCGLLLASATAGASATLAIGTADDDEKYREAATFTSADTPTLFGLAEGCGEPLEDDEEVIITVGTAALPSEGTLQVTMFYVFD